MGIFTRSTRTYFPHDPRRMGCVLQYCWRLRPGTTKDLERKYRTADAPAVERNVRTLIVVDEKFRCLEILPQQGRGARMLHQGDGCCEYCAVKATIAMKG